MSSKRRIGFWVCFPSLAHLCFAEPWFELSPPISQAILYQHEYWPAAVNTTNTALN